MQERLPKFLAPYVRRAQECIASRGIQEIHFSGPTYQMRLDQPENGDDVWTFLQLDNHGLLADSFCGCEASADGDGCVHLAASFLTIYAGHLTPMHERFESSIWNALCRLYAQKIGYESDALVPEGQRTYRYYTPSGKRVFEVIAKSDKVHKQLMELLEIRPRQTEETSMKFSNLSEKELALWRQGKPSHALLYTLSFWSDLAKWLFIMQDRAEPYEVSFSYTERGLPSRLRVLFPQLELEFFLPERSLVQLIPALGSIRSPLVVRGAEEAAIEKMHYDAATGDLYIHRKAALSSHHEITENSPIIDLEGWRYVPQEGFYACEEHPVLSASCLKGEDISELFRHYNALVQEYLQDYALHTHPIALSYHLFFDAEWNLHIQAYLFDQGDLLQGHSRDFVDFVFLDDEGFYPLKDREFPDLETVIPADQVGEFVSDHRLWLNSQDQFATHYTSLQGELAYQVTSEASLCFFSRVSLDEEAGRHRDFGTWIYIAGQGFYSKGGRSCGGSPLRPGCVVPEQNVPLFIRMMYEELRHVVGFFRESCPIQSVGLHARLNEVGALVISPHYEFYEEDRHKKIHLYGEYVYVMGEGFYELPSDCRLPEEYATTYEIPATQVTAFLLEEWENVIPLLSYVSPALQAPQSMRLVLCNLQRVQKHGYESYQGDVYYQTERGCVSVVKLWMALAKKQRFVFTEEGRIDLSEKRLDWLRVWKADRIDLKAGTLTLSVLDLLRLHALHDLRPLEGNTESLTKSAALFQQLIALEEREAPNLTGLGSDLRTYQVSGVRWLWSLYQHRLSGLLCDDMGLGKTHQAMALIASIRNQEKQGTHKSRILIVCPTSVIYHWQEKLAAHLTDETLCTYYGLGRSVEQFEKGGTILLTSYGLWRRDHEQLRELTFELAVFDEIQIAKTHTSRLYATLLDVKATMRLGMSGTPIENRLRELKALFDIVLPSYMPSEKEYRELFLRPIERDGDDVRKMMLRKFIHPFVLRRRKEDVLQDLPEKMEETRHCELTHQQRRLYSEVLALSRPAILQELVDAHHAVPYIHIFALLSRLKQICNHPASYFKKPKEFAQYHSGKWELFVVLIEAARASGQKVVVFSQYLTMLDIIECYLNQQKIGFATIRGATTDRGDQIRKFNRDPECEVFLGSLQASGLGVDLTAASVVIHYDRWWTWARENQATDRVHRIGQKRGVQVFKLVTKGTFEERIDQIISSKGKLMEDVVGVDDQETLKRFDREELMQLLQDIQSEITEEPDDEEKDLDVDLRD